ncbi:MAG: SH3 domain-containing protein [Flammeovirgaceae bacterium]|nr:SH3 domain-containing protein [Flammeovirgaceae bacterium]
MQRLIFKFLIIPSLIFLHVTCFAKEPVHQIKKADSLFTARQFTQSFALYQQSFEAGFYTPGMLLKMAFIEEGLSHKASAMYYLNLYYLATRDSEVLTKMEELASKFNLSGYRVDDESRFISWYQQYQFMISMVLVVLVFLLLVITYVQKRKQKTPYTAWITMVIVILGLAGNHFIGSSLQFGIFVNPQTYLMSGPSAGASVVAISDEGHRVLIDGKNDVWYKIDWSGKEAYVKTQSLRLVSL